MNWSRFCVLSAPSALWHESSLRDTQRRTGGTFFLVLFSFASGLPLCVQSRINGALGA